MGRDPAVWAMCEGRPGSFPPLSAQVCELAAWYSSLQSHPLNILAGIGNAQLHTEAICQLK